MNAMPLRTLRCCALAALPILLMMGRGAFAAVILTNNYAGVFAVDGTGVTDTFTGLGLPVATLVSASTGDSFSSNQIEYTVVSGQTTLANTFNQRRSGLVNSTARAIDASMYFTVTEDATYAMTGFYRVTDDDLRGGEVYFDAYLLDRTLSTTLFYSSQHSLGTRGQVFTLGGSDGDYSNFGVGAMTGTLASGHIYEWYFNNFMMATSTSDLGATAAGALTLTIDEGAPHSVAEPSVALLLGVGLTGIALVTRSSRRRCAIA